MYSIGKKIKEARGTKKLTQQKLAEQLHVSRSAISNWESERNYPDLDMIVALSNILEISLDKLLREDTLMVEEVSKEQQKNYKRKIVLRILVPLFVLSLLTISYMLYQEVGSIQTFFSPSIQTTLVLENDLSDWKRVEIDNQKNFNLDGFFWEKEIINHANSNDVLEIRILDASTKILMEQFSLKPGEMYKLSNLNRKTQYLLEVKGKNGNYILNII